MMSAGRFKEAQSLARRVSAADPYDQRGRRLLLELLVAASDSLGAATEADTLEQFLRREDIEPEPATSVAIASARHKPSAAKGDATHSASSLVGDLVGRGEEFARLIERWNAARAGVNAHLHIVGSAGMGKTRLLRDFEARLRAKRARVVHVRANPGERRMSYAAAADLAYALAHLPGAAALGQSASAALVALNPALSSVYAGAGADGTTGAEALRRRSLAVSEVARLVAEDAPLAILVDDLHWADPESKEVIAGAIARLSGVRALAITTARPNEPVVMQRDPTDLLRLEPLAPSAIADLLASIGRMPDRPWVADLPTALHDATGGVPLLVLETLQLAIDESVLSLANGAWECATPARLGLLMQAGSAGERRVRELSASERQLLLLLAVAGIPLRVDDLAAASTLELDGAAANLALLESRGFARQVGDRWTIGHDENADCVVRLSSADELRAAHRGLGIQLAVAGSADSGHSAKGVQHLLVAGDLTTVGELLLAKLRSLRRSGDWRPTSEICREFVGDHVDAATTEALCRTVPVRLRRRSRNGARTAVAAVALVGLAGTAIWIRPEPVVDAWLWVGVASDTPRAYGRVAIDGDTFLDDTSLDVRLGADRAAVERDTVFLAGTAVELPGRRWVYQRVQRDSGGIDLHLLGAAGSEERLTAAPGDDVPTDRSPDGKRVLLYTQRWDPQQHSDLAVLDLATRQVSPLTRTDATEFGGLWSPDGTRIAFGRAFHIRRPAEVCVRSVDGADERCSGYLGSLALVPMAWQGPAVLLVKAHTGEGQVLFALDTETWTFTTVVAGGTDLVVARGGELFAVRDGSSSGSPGGWTIAPIAHPRRTRPVSVVPPVNGDFVVRFGQGSRVAAYLDTIRVLVPDGGLPLDSRQRLFVRGADQRGGLHEVRALRWTSLDTSVAWVAADGLASPRRTGTFRVVASAGGWRADTAEIRVTGPQAAEVLAERWDRIDTTRWAPFGVPRPVLTRRADGPALDVNGDSTFMSGVYSTRSYSVAQGLAVRTTLSVALTALQWQAALAYVAPLDSAAVARWDHRTGDAALVPSVTRCGFTLPHSEGFDGSQYGMAIVVGGDRAVPLSRAQRGGAPLRVDIQVFPDGRCGVAVDGTPVMLSQRGLRPGQSVWIVLGGKSVRTRALVGPVEIWTGVRPGVDWSPLLYSVSTQSGRAAATP